MSNEPTFESNNSNHNTSSYQSEGYGDEQSISGSRNNPWQTDQFSDGYQENVFEVNFGDTPYSESANNPNPQLKGYGSSSAYKFKTRQQQTPPELEL